VLKRWREGKAVVNGWMAIPSGFAAETMAQSGYDSITIDIQHGVQDFQSMVECFQAMQSYPVTRLVRVPANEPGIVGKVLDCGAYGVICPLVNTKQQAEQFVSYCLYPPLGVRSSGPIRHQRYDDAPGAYQNTANAQVLVMPMIETKQAVENLEEILSVPGITAVYVGPSDLGLNWGLGPGIDREEPEILGAYKKILEETKKRGIYAGIHVSSPQYGARMIRDGFRLVSIANDASLLYKASKEAIGTVWSELGGQLK